MSSERRVLITGVSAGIGFACAETFTAEGWTVVGFDRTPPPPAFMAPIRSLPAELVTPKVASNESDGV